MYRSGISSYNGKVNGSNWRKEQKQIDWRRNKIQELLINGYTQIQISELLNIKEYMVSRDVQYLRDQARQNMQTHLQDRLPAEYENCMAGINQVLKRSWDIANCSESDDKNKLLALSLANDCYKHKMELVTNGLVVTDAIKFVKQNTEKEKESANDVQRT